MQCNGNSKQSSTLVKEIEGSKIVEVSVAVYYYDYTVGGRVPLGSVLSACHPDHARIDHGLINTSLVLSERFLSLFVLIESRLYIYYKNWDRSEMCGQYGKHVHGTILCFQLRSCRLKDVLTNE
jgi:hypothetical protein